MLLTRGKGPREQAADCLSQALGSWTPCDCRAAGAGAHTGVFLTLGHWGRLLLGIFLPPTLLFLLINMLTFLPAPQLSGERSNSHHPLHRSPYFGFS